MYLIGFPEELLGQDLRQCLDRKGPSAGILLCIGSYVGAQGEHWAGPHLGPSLSGSEFSCLLLSFLVPTYIRFRVWGFGVPQGSLHRHSALACSGAPTSTRLPSVTCGAHASSSERYHFLLPPTLASALQVSWESHEVSDPALDTSFVSSPIPGTLRGAAPAPATDVQPCLETLFWL